MGNVCSGLSRGKEEKPHTVSLQAYNEIRIIPPTPSPGVLTSSSIPECENLAFPSGEVVIVKPPAKLAPLAEPETLSPAPPPKKEITGAVVIPDSPDSDTERLLSPQGDDLTQDAVDSELLIDDTPIESPLVNDSTTTTIATKTTKTTTTIADKILANGFGICEDEVPLTDAEVLCDDSSPPKPLSPSHRKPDADSTVAPAEEASAHRKSDAAAAAAASPTIVLTTDLAASSGVAVDAPKPDVETTSTSPPSKDAKCLTTSSHEHPSSSSSSSHVAVNGYHGSGDDVEKCPIKGNVDADVKIDDGEPGLMETTGFNSDTNFKTAKETSVIMQKTVLTTEENGVRTECIDIEIAQNGKSAPPSPAQPQPSQPEPLCEVDHNLNEQSKERVRSLILKKDGRFFLEKTKNEENRIQSMCSTMEDNLSGKICEEAEGQIRAFIGKATLLTTKKFKQFKGLCSQNLAPEEGEAFQTTDEDLQGFWDMMNIQIEELDASFKDLLELKSNNWMPPVKVNESKSANTPSGTRKKGAGPKKSTPSTPRTAEAEARIKAREEQRRKLIAAKREAAKNMDKAGAGTDSVTIAEPQQNGASHVNGIVIDDAEEEDGTGLRRKKSLSFTIP